MVPVAFLNTLFPFFSTLPPFLLGLLPLSLAFIPCVFLKSIFWRMDVALAFVDSTFLLKWHILYSLSIHLQTVVFLSVEFTINIMKISQQQGQFRDSNEHFLAAGRVEESCPFGEGFHFLPPLPSSKNSLHLVDDSFRKSTLFENYKEYILQEVPVFALVLTHVRDHYGY